MHFKLQSFSLHLTLFFLFFFSSTFAQTISGDFSQLAGKEIILYGYNGFNEYIIDSTQIDSNGQFNLNYKDENYGMGFLSTLNDQKFLLVLENSMIELKGDDLNKTKNIDIIQGTENKIFEQYASEHLRREQTLSIWKYLEKIYTTDSMFNRHENSLKVINDEQERINREDSLFLSQLQHDTYISFYLPLRKVIDNASTIVQYRPEEIPQTLERLRNIDYTDNRLQKSGLMKDLIETHFWLIENGSPSLESAYVEMNKSIDAIIDNLIFNEKQLNEISEYIFTLLEKRSLFKSSEYLALRLLNEKNCIINEDLTSQLESYRAMKRGNIAPDFDFAIDVFIPENNYTLIPKKLSDIKSEYTLVVFGASWCPQCPKELYRIAQLYDKWKSQNIEVVFVSLDVNQKIFENFVSIFPFISLCDYKKWESPIVQKYHVFATPTLYLLNHKRKILLKPVSVSQIDTWIEMNNKY